MPHPDARRPANDGDPRGPHPKSDRIDPDSRGTNSTGSPPGPPSSRIGGGLFNTPNRRRQVQVLLKTAETLADTPWEAGYAAYQARSDGPTTLITMQARTVRVELHGNRRLLPTLPEALATRIDWVLSWVAFFTRSTIVVPDPGSADQPGAYLDWDVPIQLMTDAADASKVTTYRWAKGIHTICRRHTASAARLGLVFVNTCSDSARIHGRQIGATAQRFLDCTLPLAQTITRMPPLAPIQVLTFPRQPGYGCDQIMETLGCQQHPRPHGRRGAPFS